MNDPFFYLFGLVLIVLAYISIYSRESHRMVAIIISILFAAATAFRDTSVPDTPAYIQFFSLYNLDITDIQDLGHEAAFDVLGKLCKNIVDDYRLLFFVVAVANLILIYGSLINFRLNPALGLALYISFYGIYYNFIFLRSGLATSILIYSVSLFCAGRRKMAALSIISAPLFHVSTVVQISLLPFLAKFLKRRTLNILLFTSVLIYVSRISENIAFKILSYISGLETFARYGDYIENVIFEDGISVRFLINCSVVVAAINFTNNYKKIEIFAKLATFGLILNALFSSFLWVDRISDAFVIFTFLLVTAVASESGRFRNKNFFILIILPVYYFSSLFFISRICTSFLLSEGFK